MSAANSASFPGLPEEFMRVGAVIGAYHAQCCVAADDAGV
jgi:hypothetical protein